MIPIKELIVFDKSIDAAIYLQISNAIVHNIKRGHLQRGMKLPGARELSSLLNVHRKTVQTAYDELMAQGWVEILPRRGTFVAKELPEITPVKLHSSEPLLSYPTKTLFTIEDKIPVFYSSANHQESNTLTIDGGFPDVRLVPTDLLIREFRSLAKLGTYRKYFKYGGAKGATYFLEILTEYLVETRSLPISCANLMITKGAQMGIYLAAQLLIKPNDHVIVGDPSYFTATQTFIQAGAIIERVPVDDFGMDVNAIESICLKQKIRLVYVIPHHHYPTTVTLAPERRIRLLELAAQYKFAIIEDDYDYDFHYNSSPLLPMASLDNHGNVIYIGTLTKTFVPSIRVGFIVAPENFINSASNLRRSIDWQGDSMMEVAIAELYKNGTIRRHIKKVVKIYHERRDNFCDLLTQKIGDRITFKIPDGGMSVWAKFNDVDLALIADKAKEGGLIISNGMVHNSPAKNYNATRFGFASLNFNEQEEAINILSKSILRAF